MASKCEAVNTPACCGVLRKSSERATHKAAFSELLRCIHGDGIELFA
jgi:hypothetical protein